MILSNLISELSNLPEHDPQRSETTDMCLSPGITNGDRATFAAETLHPLSGYEIEDLITNLLHLAHAEDPEGPQTVLTSALLHFLAEAGPL